MALLGKLKKKKGARCCACDAESVRKAAAERGAGAYVKVLGSGCAKCRTLEAAAKEALGRLGMEPEVEHVTDFAAIAAYGVMTTPALVVGGRVVSCGRALTAAEVAGLISRQG